MAYLHIIHIGVVLKIKNMVNTTNTYLAKKQFIVQSCSSTRSLSQSRSNLGAVRMMERLWNSSGTLRHYRIASIAHLMQGLVGKTLYNCKSSSALGKDTRRFILIT